MCLIKENFLEADVKKLDFRAVLIFYADKILDFFDPPPPFCVDILLISKFQTLFRLLCLVLYYLFISALCRHMNVIFFSSESRNLFFVTRTNQFSWMTCVKNQFSFLTISKFWTVLFLEKYLSLKFDKSWKNFPKRWKNLI